ncbi:MAG: ATP-binding protein [Holosporales bacterium]|jgi:predicted AAA+ superfamily ATPase|nr:ATP-binding protein [Holosporales bacterium]
MIHRDSALREINNVFSYFPICGVIGARQIGKTTLALEYAKKQNNKYYHFDLEDPQDFQKLSDPKLLFNDLSGLVIIDEIQRMPDLFPFLRVIADRREDIKLLILGSSSRDLLEKSNESLAGRVSYIELTPFTLLEVDDHKKLWLQGGFPRAYLAPNVATSFFWLKDYVSSFVERDLRVLGFNLDPQNIRRLLIMLAQSHGNTINYSDISKSIGVSDVTIKKYIDILENAFVITLLKPWFENISKRQIKAPKIYIKDSGILHYLLGVNDAIELHPKCGLSWKSFAIQQIIKQQANDKNDAYFWRTNAGAELDLLIIKNSKRVGFEIKYTSIPKVTPSMLSAIEDLKLDQLFVVIPKGEPYPLKENIKVIGLYELLKLEVI